VKKEVLLKKEQWLPHSRPSKCASFIFSFLAVNWTTVAQFY